ncbi:MAG: PDZ domain-containing protein [Phycisphaerae bacterium]|nr:PDZ domain-containing protein [Saprospiraceae bacterium]
MYRFSFKQWALLPALLLAFGALLPAQEYSYNFISPQAYHRSPCKPFIGVGTSKVTEGLKVDYTVDNTPATQYGVLAGDVILTLDGVPVHSQPELLRERDKHQQGEAFSLTILREGVEKTINARFKECNAEELEAVQQNKWEHLAEMEIKTVPSADRGYFNYKMERDPCKVFIGVYTGANGPDGRGIRVDGVIDNTPAKTSDVQPGDIILAFNGISVNSYQALTTERDKNKPGDAFRLTVLRNSANLEIKAKFKPCGTPGKAPVKETAQVMQEDKTSEQREVPKSLDNTLNLVVFEAYPSPTLGLLNIQFEAEAVPTAVRIQDVAGRVVYRKDLPLFGGSFNEQVNLSNNKAGNYVLSVQQGDRVQSKQIVLLPRA